MLIRRRLETLRAIVEEYGLCLDIRFVSSAENKADALTLVPKRWLGPERDQLACGAAVAITEQDIAKIHVTSGHPAHRVTPSGEASDVKTPPASPSSWSLVFLERGAPKELLTDKATSFRSSLFGEFANRWGIAIRYRCAHVPSGNGISERCNRTVKTILARKGCSVAEAVYRYNVMPRGNDAASAPANQILRYEMRLLGIDEVGQQNQSADDQPRYSIGDRVWIRHPSRCCDSRSLESTVTRLVSPQNIEVDGMPRHVRDLRLVTSSLPTPGELSASEQPDVVEEDDALLIQVPGPARGSEEGTDSPERPQLRRGSRERRPTQLFFNVSYSAIKVKKCNVPCELMRQDFLCRLNALPECPNILYTDGSLHEDGRAGAGVVYYKGESRGEHWALSIRMSDGCSSTQTELLKIAAALAAVK
ncbi:hypothetical protein GWK47_014927 [Chionoecetes opilio]|uniref:Integrase catalytic domain-containing protein n=1 Tax=Chionoecetes opilio TaxID=41210 RepID=A0A8J5CIJ9_CHIOP|nr:hypothetical protein GWK47_014927 [Chionoecetes opilio]